MTRPHRTIQDDRFGRPVADARARLQQLTTEKWSVTYGSPRFHEIQAEIDALSGSTAEYERRAPVLRREFQARTGQRGLKLLGAAVVLGAATGFGWLPWLVAVPVVALLLVAGLFFLGRRS
jgi:hypothetical protein